MGKAHLSLSVDSEIIEQAKEARLNISEVCTAALAAKLGLACSQAELSVRKEKIVLEKRGLRQMQKALSEKEKAQAKALEEKEAETARLKKAALFHKARGCLSRLLDRANNNPELFVQNYAGLLNNYSVELELSPETLQERALPGKKAIINELLNHALQPNKKDA